MKTPVYFLSDIHFDLKDSPQEKEKLQKLSQLFDEIRKTNGTLFIVGDFFDFWFEYKSVIPRQYFSVLAKLNHLSSAGCDIHYLGGNHDFWLSDFLKDTIGATLYYDPVSTTINNKKFYIAHGDGIDEADKGYLFLKKILRHKIAIKLFSCIPPTLAFKIASLVSGTSRKYDNKTDEIEQQNRQYLIQFATQKFEQGYDCVVMGHYHLPEEYHPENKVYLNCGDWLNNFTYGLFDGQQLKLKRIK